MTDNAFPIDEYGNLLTANHMSFLHERMKEELFRRAQKLSSSEGSDTDKIDYPTTADVILGRGRPYRKYYRKNDILNDQHHLECVCVLLSDTYVLIFS